MHHVTRSSAFTLRPLDDYAECSAGYTAAPIIDGTSGAIHTHLSLNELSPSGYIGRHMHAFEEGFYVLAGEVVVAIEDEVLHLVAGDFGALKAGTVHAWRAIGSVPARWLQVAAPPPKPPHLERDTFFAKHRVLPHDGVRVIPGDHRALVGHFDASQIPQATHAAETIAAPGVFLRWMNDEAFGARHHRMAFIEYQPGASIDRHDHTFEEAYYVLSGEIEAILDGQTYAATAGDVIWTAVGCVHAFVNRSSQPVCWIETFAPQPPSENVFRFFAEWAKRGEEFERS